MKYVPILFLFASLSVFAGEIGKTDPSRQVAFSEFEALRGLTRIFLVVHLSAPSEFKTTEVEIFNTVKPLLEQAKITVLSVADAANVSQNVKAETPVLRIDLMGVGFPETSFALTVRLAEAVRLLRGKKKVVSGDTYTDFAPCQLGPADSAAGNKKLFATLLFLTNKFVDRVQETNSKSKK